MLIQLVGVVILSRLLSPDDFGLIAMVTVFMTFADLLRDFGMPSAALQAKELSHQQASNMFWVSVGLGAASAVVLAACTPLIVALYDEPRLALIVPAMALTILLSGPQAQLQVQLARRLRFTALAVSATIAPLIGLMVAIAAALAGWGYWALVAQLVVAALVRLVAQAWYAKWVPALPRRRHGSAELFTSGAQLGIAYFLAWAASNVDTLVVGARWGATSLGYYNRGFQLTAMPVGSFLSPLTQVAIPTLNAATQNGRRPGDLLLRLQFIVAAPTTALMIALALTAPSLVPLLLGPEWVPSVAIVQILAVGECIHALSFVSYWGFLAERLSKQLLYYNLVTKPISVALVVLGSFFGVEGVAWGYVAGLAVSWPVNLLWLSRAARFNSMTFFLRGLRLLATAAIAYLLAYLALHAPLAAQSWSAVLGGVALVTVLFLGLQALFPEGRDDLAWTLRVARTLL